MMKRRTFITGVVAAAATIGLMPIKVEPLRRRRYGPVEWPPELLEKIYGHRESD